MAARALACVADVLGCMAEGQGGLRSGPAANPGWMRPFSYLECGDLAGGVQALAQERDKWLTRWVLMTSRPLERSLAILGGGDPQGGGASSYPGYPEQSGPQAQTVHSQLGAACQLISLPSWQAGLAGASCPPL